MRVTRVLRLVVHIWSGWVLHAPPHPFVDALEERGRQDDDDNDDLCCYVIHLVATACKS